MLQFRSRSHSRLFNFFFFLPFIVNLSISKSTNIYVHHSLTRSSMDSAFRYTFDFVTLFLSLSLNFFIWFPLSVIILSCFLVHFEIFLRFWRLCNNSPLLLYSRPYYSFTVNIKFSFRLLISLPLYGETANDKLWQAKKKQNKKNHLYSLIIGEKTLLILSFVFLAKVINCNVGGGGNDKISFS